jgi:hypothetical protein
MKKRENGAEAVPERWTVTASLTSMARRAAVLAPWIVTSWLAVMTSWYLKTVVLTLRHPNNKGDDLKLAAVWLILVAAVVLSHSLLRRRTVTVVWTLGLIAVGLMMVILSRQTVSALITIWLLALAWIYGDWVLRRVGAKPSAVPFEWACLAGTIGLVVLSMVGLTLLLLHRMTARGTWVVLIILTLIQGRSFLALFASSRRKMMSRSGAAIGHALPEQGVLLVLLGLVWLFNLAWALAPEIMYDGIWYHLTAPRTYLNEHRLVNLTYGCNAHLVETIFTMALALHGQIVAKLLVLAMSVMATLAVYAAGHRLFNPRAGLWASALFYSTPLVSWLSSTTYVDLVVALFLVVALLAMFRWRENRQLAWMLATGGLAGAALGAKMNALFGLPVITLLPVKDLLFSCRLPAWSKLKNLVGYALVAALVAAPYFLISFSFTGNPFFPLLHGFFTTGSFNPALNLDPTVLTSFGLGYSPLVFLKLPFLLTFESDRFGQSLSAGGLGIALALLPLGFLSLARRHMAGILLAACALFLALWCYTMPLARYYIPILPVVAVLAVGSVVDFSAITWLRRFNLVCLGVLLVAQVAVIPSLFWNIPERVPLSLAFGAESRDSFLARALPMYRAVQFINGNRVPGKKVLGVGTNNMRFYLKNEMSTARDMTVYPKELTMQELATLLARDGFDFLLVNRQSELFSWPLPYLRESFLSQYAVLEYVANDTYVYRLRETNSQSAVDLKR